MILLSPAFSIILLLTTLVHPSLSCYKSYVPDRKVEQRPPYNITDLPWLKRDWYFFNGERVSPKMRNYIPNCECGTNKYLAGHEKTVGGWNATVDEYPWSVWFKTRATNGQTCGASIIGDRMILTAAHCLTNLENYTEAFEAKEFVIYINTINLKNSPKVIGKAVAFYTNPHFLEGILATTENTPVFYDHDIGIIILEDPITFTRATDPKPICLPNIGAVDIKANMRAEIIGYGLKNVKNGSSSDIMKKGSVSIMDVNECIKNIATDPQNRKVFAFDASSVICTGTNKLNGQSTQILNSDFGGSLSVASISNSKKIQIGIMSGSDKAFDKVGDPIYFYTKVEAHLPLIDYYAKKHNVRWCR